MSDQDKIIIIGDQVRIRYGRNAGETGTVSNVTWHGNQFGTYAQVHIRHDDGQVDVRTMEDLEIVKETEVIVRTLTASAGK